MKFLHPFPARMAPELAMRALGATKHRIRVLDPMMGSGTAIVSARMSGHEGIGIDRDPLAVLIAQASTQDLDSALLQSEGRRVLERAKDLYRGITKATAYPERADEESKAFLRYWFDFTTRRQLAALMSELSHGRYRLKPFLRIAISRMIITKQGGVSLAEDVSHSRPHRTRDLSPSLPFEIFMQCVNAIARNTNFPGKMQLPKAQVLRADCRYLPFADNEFDYILTSPPYLNAIDYLRGHRMSLVWLGHSIAKLREIRSTNIGADRGVSDASMDYVIEEMIDEPELLTSKLRNTLRLFARDLKASLTEMRRVIKDGGTALFVIGDCTIRGIEVRNSDAVDMIARDLGFNLISRRRRQLPPNRRYLPPPSKLSAERELRRRMWDEIILKYKAL